jgi:D-serine deaminase-like pyridoxal phosphate-dependent protein
MYEATLQAEGALAVARPDGAPDDARGSHWQRLDTPALLVDLDKLDDNIASMAAQASQVGLALRPHFKTHKSIDIARRQLAAGAVGITVAKLDEAEALIEHGIEAPILLAYQVVSAPKLDRAMELAARGALILAVDSAAGASILGRSAAGAGITLEVWIEIDSGLRRCGVVSAEAPALARKVGEFEALRLTGMFTHAGQSYAAADEREVEAIAGLEADAVVQAALATRAIGIPIETISAGSTPTARFLRGGAGLTEMRPGTYVFYDELQVALGTVERDRCALSIATTVVSRPAADRAVIDAGSKTFGLDRGAHSSSLLTAYGHLVDAEGSLVRLSEEHGVLDIPAESPIAIGDRVRIVPNHVCSVSNLGRWFYALRGDVVETVISIDASGGVH